MSFHVARGVIVLILSMAALVAHAVTYEITTTLDGAPLEDGQCTIREAVQAATTQTDVGDCPAGTGSDRLVLEPGQEYVLDNGELQVGGGGVNLNLRLLVPDPENDDPAVLNMAGNSRAFNVAAGSTLVLDGVSARNGFPSSGNGGLVLSEGSFEVRNGGMLENGEAANGGLIHATGTVRVLSGARLTGGHANGDGGAIYLHGVASLAVVDSRIGGDTVDTINTADTNGGAVALAPDFAGALVFQNALLDGNVATGGDGGALFFRGDQVRFQLINTSLLANEAPQGAGALFVGTVTSDQDIDINNVTVADNLSGPGSGSVDILAADEFDTVFNSVIVGDRGAGDCAGQLGAGSAGDIVVEFTLLGKDPSSTPGTPVACHGVGEGVVTLLDMTILRGVDAGGDVNACAGATTDDAVCDPVALDPFPGYLPGLLGANSPWNNGNPQDQGEGSCETQDQRGVSRLENTCDIGSLEFAVAVGEDDEFPVIQGRTVQLDIITNDLGDGRIDCRRADVSTDPLAPFLPDYQSNGPGDTDLDNDGVDDVSEPQPFDVDQCAQILIPPSRDGANVRFIEDPDLPGSLLLEYAPGSAYHGLDEVAYRINRAAFEPTRDPGVYATRGNRNVEGVAFIISEPASGFQEKETIDRLGATGGLSLMLLVMLGMLRRFRHCLAAVMLVAMGTGAGAAEISVTTMEDNFAPGDGFCSVREALYSSIDELVNLEGACENGQGGQDTVVLPRGCIQLDPANGPLVVDSSVVIEGQGVHGVDAGNLPDGSECSPNDDTNPNWTEGSIIVGDQEQIIDARSQLELQSLSLFGGRSPGNGGALRSGAGLTVEQVEFYDNISDELGGAIYLAGVPDDTQEVRIEQAYFLNNQALQSGGAIAMSGAADYEVVIGDTTFEGNRAEQSGGAMLVNPGGGTVKFANTLITGNTAGVGTGGLDVSEALARVHLMNSTILDNTGGDNSGLDLGAPHADRSVSMTNSIYALNYVWDAPPGNPGDGSTLDGDCSSDASGGAPGDEVLNKSRDNLYSSSVVLSSECPASERSDDEQPVGSDEADVKTEFQTDGSNNLVTAPNVPADTTEFIPPNLLVLTSSTLIKDRGYDGALASGYDSINSCRALDQRGLPRTSGQRCDRGAFEVQETTAIDDEVNNKGNGRAELLIDILDNDSTDPARTIPPEDVSFVTVPANAGAVMVLKADPEVACDPSEPDYDEGCVLRYDPEDTTPLDPDDAGSETPFGCIPDGSTVTQTLTYNFTDSDGQVSNDANVEITLNNLPPRIEDEVFYNEPGGTVVFELQVTDPFASNGPVDMATLSLEKEPQFAAEDEFGNVLGTGIKLNTPAPGYVTYVAGDTTKRFRDNFSLSVEDDCGTKSTGGRITIQYETEDVSGGDLLSGGASLTPFVLLLLMGGFRRRVSR